MPIQYAPPPRKFMDRFDPVTKNRCSICCGCCCWLALFLITLISIFTFLAGKYGPAPKCEGFGPSIYKNRGDLRAGQENSLPAVKAATSVETLVATKKDMFQVRTGAAIDAAVTMDGTVVAFADKSLKRLTGIDALLVERSFAEVTVHNLTAIIDGYNYKTSTGIPVLSALLVEVCKHDENFKFLIRVNSVATAEKVGAVVSNAKVTCKGTFNFEAESMYQALSLMRALDVAGMKGKHNVGIPLHPGAYSGVSYNTIGWGFFDIGFFLRTALMHYMGGVQMMSTHHLVWDADKQFVTQYQKLGYCTGVYGISCRDLNRAVFLQYPTADYFVCDELPTSEGGVIGFPGVGNGHKIGGDKMSTKLAYTSSFYHSWIITAVGGICSAFWLILTIWLLCFSNDRWWCQPKSLARICPDFVGRSVPTHWGDAHKTGKTWKKSEHQNKKPPAIRGTVQADGRISVPNPPPYSPQPSPRGRPQASTQQPPRVSDPVVPVFVEEVYPRVSSDSDSQGGASMPPRSMPLGKSQVP